MLGCGSVASFGGEDIAALMESYRAEAELSKITKKESAGVIDVFTRDMLEKMQAHTLADALKTLPVLNYARRPNNTLLFSKSSIGFMPINATRLYINDHDVTSASFGSALLIWGDMPIEQVDHIEVYKGTSSIEFGNEAGTVVIKVYTKSAEREEGGKLRLMADDAGSYEAHGYVAHTLENGMAAFLYGEKDEIERDTYDRDGYTVRSDKSGHLLFAQLQWGPWRLDASNYHKHRDSFLGRRPYKPDGGELDAMHSYLHLDYVNEGYKVTLAYDDLDYDRSYIQPEGMRISTITTSSKIRDYRLGFDDRIFTAQLEKSLRLGNLQLMTGGFYKYKSYESDGRYVDLGGNRYASRDSLGLNLYSLYAEAHYAIGEDRMVVASVKGDFYDYTHTVADDTEWISRLGYLQHAGPWSFKLFWVNGYLPTPMYQISGSRVPLLTNPDLGSVKVRNLTTADLAWEEANHRVDLQLGYSQTRDAVSYLPGVGYFNKKMTGNYSRAILRYTYRWNPTDFTRLSWYGGRNNPSVHMSPDYGVLLESYNTLGPFDLFNAVHYRGPYHYLGHDVKASYDYTVAVKYHVSDDLAVGLRGENLFGTGYKQVYAPDIDPIPVYDRKVWVNLEYLF